MKFYATLFALAGALSLTAPASVKAEMSEITVAQQYGVAFCRLWSWRNRA